MDFGKLSNIDQIDFTLPPDDISNATLFPRLKKHNDQNFQIFVGCPVWADKSYIGITYPKGTKPKDYLHFYARQFNCIELNATHYNLPSISQVMKWKLDVPDDFHFNPKFPKFISHRRKVDERKDVINEFLTSIYHFEENLGTSFIQLPPYFKPTDKQYLYNLIDFLPEDFSFAVELRHQDWFVKSDLNKEVFDFMEEKGVGVVITDVAGRRDVLHQRLTCDTAFIRFTGNDLHTTDYTRLDSWVDRLVEWKKKGLKKIYFFMHEPKKSDSTYLVDYFIKKMKSVTEIQIKSPILYGINSGQQSLF